MVMLYDETNARYTIEVAEGADTSCAGLAGKLVPVEPATAAVFGQEKYRAIDNLARR